MWGGKEGKVVSCLVVAGGLDVAFRVSMPEEERRGGFFFFSYLHVYMLGGGVVGGGGVGEVYHIYICPHTDRSGWAWKKK
jgi:hypothetical protein